LVLSATQQDCRIPLNVSLAFQEHIVPQPVFMRRRGAAWKDIFALLVLMFLILNLFLIWGLVVSALGDSTVQKERPIHFRVHWVHFQIDFCFLWLLNAKPVLPVNIVLY
jgi:hypothetical protein